MSFLVLGDDHWSGADDLKSFAIGTRDAEFIDFRNDPSVGQPLARPQNILFRIWIGLIARWRELWKAKRLFRHGKFQLLIVCEDGLGAPLRVISEARKFGLDVIIVPYEYSTKESIFRALVGSTEIVPIKTLQHKIVALLFPKWVGKFSGNDYFRLPIIEILAREFLCLSIPNPWTVHGGHASLLLAESEFMFRHYLKEGVPASKIRITGSISHDEIFSNKLTLDTGRSFDGVQTVRHNPIRVVVSFPPSYFSSKGLESEFDTYEELIESWVKLLESTTNLQVVYQAHPSTVDQDLFILKKYVELDNRAISELIADCDLLITSYSSVIRIAISCHKPVINYDAYLFEFPDYLGVPGVYNVSDYTQLSHIVCKFATPDFYKGEVETFSTTRYDWGRIDGLAWSRIRSAIDESLLTG